MHKIDKKKVSIGFGILIAIALIWPLIISTFIISPKIKTYGSELASLGMKLEVKQGEGYFNSQQKYTLTVQDRDKFLIFLSSLIKIDKVLLESILSENDDVVGLQFSGKIIVKVWHPFSVSVYIQPSEFPKNQIKLVEYKELLKKFGAEFIFNLQGKLKEIDANNIDINSQQSGTNMLLNFSEPVLKLGDKNRFTLEKYLIQTNEEDKKIKISSNNPEYNYQYTNDYNFKFESTADDFLYNTKYHLNNPDEYTIFLAKKISEEAIECKNIRCIKAIADNILKEENHIDSFEIYLDSRIIDGIRYKKSGNKTYEIRHQDGTRNLEYRIAYTKDDFEVPNVEFKTLKNTSNIEVKSNGIDMSVITNTKASNFSLKTSKMNIKAKETEITGGLNHLKLAPIKYIMDNTDQFSSLEIDGYSPLLKYVIEIANHGGEMKYGMKFSELTFSKVKFPIKSVKIDSIFTLKPNKYNILNQPKELLDHIKFNVNVQVDKESFENYLKSSANEYKNLDKVVRYDGDTALLNIDFNLKNDGILVNKKELIK